MTKRKPLCEACANRELAQAFACYAKEMLLKTTTAEPHKCDCPLIVCEHEAEGTP